MIFRCLVILILCSSCAFFSQLKKDMSMEPVGDRKPRIVYELTDQSGKFNVIRESGRNKDKFIVKKQVLTDANTDAKVLEKSITISEMTKFNKDIDALRPERSQFTVWFSGKKYFSEMKIDKSSRTLNVLLDSPEKQWRGQKTFPIPKTSTGVFCFYSQVLECAAATGFISKAIKKDAGRMNFHIIMDGWPYFQEQYEGIPENPFVSASLEYDGVNSNNEAKFTLRFGEQVSFYMVDRNYNLKKYFWIRQGLSMVELRPENK